MKSRTATLIALVACGACFNPKYTPGLPCSPTGACPPGQRCEPAANVCEPIPERVTSATAGALRTCAVLDTGGVRCWGASTTDSSSYDVLGYKSGSVGDDETPAEKGDLRLGAAAVQVALGEGHSCALLTDGGVRCWGQNYSGELGLGRTSEYAIQLANTETIRLGEPARQICAAGSHTCAVLESGIVRCWGNDHGYGVIGVPGAGDIGANQAPAEFEPVKLGGAATQVACGHMHNCALRDDGRVLCWGSHHDYRIGYDTLEDVGKQRSPAEVGPLPLTGVIQVATGSSHSCALLAGGRVRCWGAGTSGQLGRGDLETNVVAAEAGEVNLGEPAVELALGLAHSCARTESGKVRCWGLADVGQLGYGNTNNIGDNEPPSVAGPVDLGGEATQISAGNSWGRGSHTCALLTSGRLRCWGLGEKGRLGYGNTSNIGDDEAPSQAGDVPVF